MQLHDRARLYGEAATGSARMCRSLKTPKERKEREKRQAGSRKSASGEAGRAGKGAGGRAGGEARAEAGGGGRRGAEAGGGGDPRWRGQTDGAALTSMRLGGESLGTFLAARTSPHPCPRHRPAGRRPEPGLAAPPGRGRREEGARHVNKA